MERTDTGNSLTVRLIRWGGLANVIGGIAVALAYVLHPPSAPPEVVGSPFWVFVHAVFLVSLLGGIFGLFALLAAYLEKGGGLLGFAGCAMAVVSLVLIAGLDYSEVFIFPTLAKEFPAVVEKYGAGDQMPSVAFAFPASGLLFLAGYLLFSNELRRAVTVPAPGAWVTLAGVAAFAVGLSGQVPMLVTRAGAVVFGLGLVMMGWALARWHGSRA